MKVTAKKSEVLATLRVNRAEHQVIVIEARAGYLAKAREAVAAKLDALGAGKLVALSFGLVMPQDQTNEYDAAIRMLELHTGDTVELNDDMVRCLVMNEWAWMPHFVGTNAIYSKTASDKIGSAP